LEQLNEQLTLDIERGSEETGREQKELEFSVLERYLFAAKADEFF
jgi:hypothetical protein